MIATSKTNVIAVCILACFIAAAIFSGVAHTSVAAEPAPALDQLLTQAMDQNSSITAMKAKVAMADADLRNTRFEVARQLVACWNEIDAHKQAIVLAEKQVEIMEERYQKGYAPVALHELTSSKSNLIDLKAKLARAQSELKFLAGQAPPPVSAPSRSTSSSNSTTSRAPLQIPGGPMVENIRQALNTPTEAKFVDMPLSDVVEYIRETHNTKHGYSIEIQIDKESLNAVGLSPDLSVTMGVKAPSLAAFLQYWDDNVRKLKFVVRDYGILVTTPERAQEAGYMSVVEFARLGTEVAPSVAGKGSVFESDNTTTTKKPKSPETKPFSR